MRHIWKIPEILKVANQKGEFSSKTFTRIVILFNYALMKRGRLRPGVLYAYNFDYSNQFENNCKLFRKVLTHRGSREAINILKQYNILTLLKNHTFNQYFHVSNHGKIFGIADCKTVRIDPRDLYQPYLLKFNQEVELWKENKQQRETYRTLTKDEIEDVRSKASTASSIIKIAKFCPDSMTFKQYEIFLEQYEQLKIEHPILTAPPMKALIIYQKVYKKAA